VRAASGSPIDTTHGLQQVRLPHRLQALRIWYDGLASPPALRAAAPAPSTAPHLSSSSHSPPVPLPARSALSPVTSTSVRLFKRSAHLRKRRGASCRFPLSVLFPFPPDMAFVPLLAWPDSAARFEGAWGLGGEGDTFSFAYCMRNRMRHR
jgi:hypothetical protein